jgi:hypothetical protein
MNLSSIENGQFETYYFLLLHILFGDSIKSGINNWKRRTTIYSEFFQNCHEIEGSLFPERIESLFIWILSLLSGGTKINSNELRKSLNSRC